MPCNDRPLSFAYRWAAVAACPLRAHLDNKLRGQARSIHIDRTEPVCDPQPGGDGNATPGDNSTAGATQSANPSQSATVQPSVKPSDKASAKASTPAKDKGKKLAKTGFDQSLLALTVALLLGAGATMAISTRRRNGR